MKFLIGSKNDFKENSGKEIVVDRREIAVFKIKDQIFAIKNICPHKGWKLHDGLINENIFSVKCNGHGWEFNLKTGEYLGNPNIKLRVFPVIEEGNNLYIEI